MPGRERSFDAVIVGAGFSGVYMLHRLRQSGLSAKVFEAGDGTGGTWYWNRYPGARCDVESMSYSYQFSEELQQQWDWTERYASQPEILAYINHVIDRFDLLDGIQLNTRVISASFDEDSNKWIVTTDQGEQVTATYLIMATGCLSSANIPDFMGLNRFRGNYYHTGQWPQDAVDFTGQHVGIIGTGSSGVQLIPIIAEQVEHLYVFQRTPTYVVPAHNRPLDDRERDAIKSSYAAFRLKESKEPGGTDFRTNYGSAFDVSPDQREQIYEDRWQQGGLPFMGAFGDLLFDLEANRTAQDFIRNKIRQIVHDPGVAEKLCPSTVFACKRLCVGTDYYETYNRDNVTLVDISHAPVDEITYAGLTTGGREYVLDSIVFATGFDAMTGAIFKVDIKGRGGMTLKDKWAAGPRNYLGLMTTGFPNLFTITGPGSPSVLSNMVASIEFHVNFIGEFIDFARERKCCILEPAAEAENDWVGHVNEVADRTLFPQCNSWYLGANIPGKPRIFMPYFGFPQYADICHEISADNYRGFILSNGGRGQTGYFSQD